jgi:hypothetical protein
MNIGRAVLGDDDVAGIKIAVADLVVPFHGIQSGMQVIPVVASNDDWEIFLSNLSYWLVSSGALL